MKFLICGIGSIGQRHYKNLRSLGHELALFRAGGGANAPFIEQFLLDEKSAGREVKAYYNFLEAVEEFRPQAVFITNPNSRHLETALLAARSGLHLFIEKPLSHNRKGLKTLKTLADNKKLKIMVGYNLRWHPLLIKMKSMVVNGDIGQPLSAILRWAKISKIGIPGRITVRPMPRTKMAEAERFYASVMILIICTGFSVCRKK